MPILPRVDRAIQRGRGKTAGKIGQTFAQRRLMPNSTGSIFIQAPITTQFPVMLTRAKKVDVEDEIFTLIALTATCDNRQLQLGDLLTETGYGAELTSYVYAQRRPMKPTIWMRTESVATITRPNAEAATDPASNTTPVTPSVTFGDYTPPGVGPNTYAGRDPATDLTLSLIAGQYSFGNGPAAQVPIGIAPVSRVGTSGGTQFAENLSQTRFYGYLPPMPGVTLQRLDRIDVPARGTSYVVQMTYANSVGLVGTVCVLEQDDQP